MTTITWIRSIKGRRAKEGCRTQASGASTLVWAPSVERPRQLARGRPSSDSDLIELRSAGLRSVLPAERRCALATGPSSCCSTPAEGRCHFGACAQVRSWTIAMVPSRPPGSFMRPSCPGTTAPLAQHGHMAFELDQGGGLAGIRGLQEIQVHAVRNA